MTQRTRTRFMCSALTISDDAAAPLPSEFLLFVAGLNQTYNGDFIFDAQAAADVMAVYQRRGVDLMIDLNHDSLDSAARKLRSDAGDAMGWFKIELRADGSLWATEVRWSTEGERRIRARLQRYTSPAMLFDADTGRVIELINCALCADPATYDNAPLMAASRRNGTHSSATSGALVELCKAMLVRVITTGASARK